MSHVSRNAQVLKYFVQVCPSVGRTQLIKFAYLADCEARRYLGRPISQFTYHWHHFGPFDKAFYDAVGELVSNGLTSEECIPLPGGGVSYKYRDSGVPVAFDFTGAEVRILGYVADRYIKTDLRELLEEVVYQTEPMKAVTKRGQRLPMSLLDNSSREELGLDLDRLFQSEEQAAAGKARELAEVVRDLQTSVDRASRGGPANDSG